MRRFSDETKEPEFGKKAKIRLILRRLVNTKESVFSHWKPVGLGLITAGLASFAQIAYAIDDDIMAGVQGASGQGSLQTTNQHLVVLKENQNARKAQKKEEIRKLREEAKEILETKGQDAHDLFLGEAYTKHADRILKMEIDKANLKLSLLKQGKVPGVDVDAEGQVYLLEFGMDLSEVVGTDQYVRLLESRDEDFNEMLELKERLIHQIIKMKVEDCKMRGIDPISFFERKTDSAQLRQMREPTEEFHKAKWYYDQRDDVLQNIIARMEENLELFGSIEPPVPGFPSIKERIANDPSFLTQQEEKFNEFHRQRLEKFKEEREELRKTPISQRYEALTGGKEKRMKAQKQEMKEKKKIAKAKAKEEARLRKEIEKEQKRVEKAQERNSKKEARQQKVKNADKLSVVSSTVTTVDAPASGISAFHSDTVSSGDAVSSNTIEDFEDDEKYITENGPDFVETTSKDKSLPIGKISGAIAVVIGGKFVIDRGAQKTTFDEAERERQFKLLMGISDDDEPPIPVPPSNSADVLDTTLTVKERKDDTLTSINGDNYSDPEDPPKMETVPPLEKKSKPKKRRGLGIKNMFSKKKNNRETDLNNLLKPDATAPGVAKLLAKLLTYGAPGRFPQINTLSGETPFEKEYDNDRAKEMLEAEARVADLSQVDGAELFANVVNCMFIDLVDLASSSLQEKSEVTYDALNIVYDFMQHAGSLYDSVAGGVEIDTVTYGGTLPKSKLEALYGAYSLEIASKFPDDCENRLSMLQEAFSIPDRKKNGIMMKVFQDSMMEMAKTEEGQKAIEEMASSFTGGMGGMEGLGGMGGMLGAGGDEEPDMEQVKEMLKMLKQMKDDGSIPPKEFKKVRNEFKKTVGSSLDDLMKTAESEGELSPEERELFDLMKAIFED